MESQIFDRGGALAPGMLVGGSCRPFCFYTADTSLQVGRMAALADGAAVKAKGSEAYGVVVQRDSSRSKEVVIAPLGCNNIYAFENIGQKTGGMFVNQDGETVGSILTSRDGMAIVALNYRPQA